MLGAAPYRVSLTTTPLPWGGLRWWFTCPLVVEGRSCGRRVGKLYLPPGRGYFGCANETPPLDSARRVS